jgi:hypothetical protein
MSALVKPRTARHYHIDYSSDAVGSDAAEIALMAGRRVADNSITIDHRQAALFQRIIDVRDQASEDDWDGNGASKLTEESASAAIRLLYALPDWLPPPEITAETTGEIAFEWYRDQAHIAVLTVEDNEIRWAALMGDRPSVSGAAAFVRTIPVSALESVKAVVE